MKSGLRVAVVGATGAVGREMLQVLSDRHFPCASVRAFASPNSVGKLLDFGEDTLRVESLESISDPSVFDLALFSCGSERSLVWAPRFARSGCIVIDNSSAWRNHDKVPLVVPEVNAQDLDDASLGVIAVPNCSTIGLVQAIAPLHRNQPLRRVVVTTFQSVSGSGRKGIEELDRQTRQLFNAQGTEPKVYPKRIAFNVLPLIGEPDVDGYTAEERKLMTETLKILGDDQIQVIATATRVPVFVGHALSVVVEPVKAIDVDEARALIADHPGVLVTDAESVMNAPTPEDIAGEDLTLVGRVRRDPSSETGLALWIVSDNLRKGAALNAVQIAETMIRRGLLAPKHKGRQETQ
ncbi:MAG TPA: aspartate-semialdehyde dehydrogenase [Myxococcales bacterium]|nr:aspartate-semialdehyde dehydrogenase [Myxococcales bacterium]HBU47770.1 aspartate-semialdehyde dehydrogenase [Myxococcales bacterium]